MRSNRLLWQIGAVADCERHLVGDSLGLRICTRALDRARMDVVAMNLGLRERLGERDRSATRPAADVTGRSTCL